MSQNQRKINEFFNLHRPNRPATNPGIYLPPQPLPNSSNPKPPQCLRLPNHTRKLWDFSKGRLLSLATRQNCTIESILEYICELIIHCRILKKSDLNISVLTQYLNENDNPETLLVFSKIASYALEVEILFPSPILFLEKYADSSLTLSNRQIRCLIALQFFCCFPKQDQSLDLPSDYTYAKIFNHSFADTQAQIAKIHCVINYFKREENLDELYLTFSRRLVNPPDWENFTELSQVELITDKNCTEDYRDKYMVDFANKSIGGGVLTSGAVQEEIMFHKHVQPIAMLLFTEKLEDNEAVFIRGAQRFNETKGFKAEFRFVADFHEALVLDEYGRNNCYIVAIDATDFKHNESFQFQRKPILRELNKAYAGFIGDVSDFEERDIISGRWGCGAFCGNEKLKFVVQWLAASAARRKLFYLLWDTEDIHELHLFIQLCKDSHPGKIFKALLSIKNHSKIFEELITALNTP